MPSIEVCFSPVLYPFILKTDDAITVVIDVLRATTSFCTAFDYGVSSIIPLDSLEEAIKHKQLNHLVAAERDGIKPDFADFSNSAFDFMIPEIKDKTIYYTTTNGTKAIQMAALHGRVAIASFLNIPAISSWLNTQNKNVILLCAGWKDNFCIEDTLCAGAIAEKLIINKNYQSANDSTLAALISWRSCNGNPEDIIKQSSHYNRLKKLGYEDILSYSLQIGVSNSVPVISGDQLVNMGA